ncbi:MAG: FtsQ-type POTRA domain-containing protein [Lentisphaerae bacterium]|nr:FtsQ-type POTRA domain-containing protein [Lentisphaerota bacterium]
MAIKNTAKKNPSSKKTTGGSAKNAETKVTAWRCFLFCLFLLLCLAVIGGIVYFVCQIPGKLIYGNERFQLRKVEIHDSEYWRNRGNELLGRVGVPLRSNLFAIDVKNVRKRVSSIPNIKQVEVKISLPDKIILKLEERVPLARVGRDRVVDFDAVIFKAAESSVEISNLPVISGNVDEQAMLVKALQLIDAVNRNFYWIKISTIEIKESYLEVNLLHQQISSYRILLPVDGDFKDLLRKFETTIAERRSKGKEFSGVDLRFPGAGVLL